MIKTKSPSLVEDFHKYFDIHLADTPAKLESVYAMRYRVYCEEFGFEPPEAYPDKLEKDEFDTRSSHALVTHNATGGAAGCARLVRVDEQSQLPVEKYCAGVLDEAIIRSFDGKRDTICEFSRLGVDSAFRRRPGEGQSLFGEVASIDCSKREERTFSLIAVAAILSGLAMSDMLGRPHCFAMMEAFLPRLLRRSGLIVHPAGDAIEYHGLRTPYYFESQNLVSGATDEFQEFYADIHSSLNKTSTLSPDTQLPSASADLGGAPLVGL
ncbi:MAG: N-acyl amino acid synthase of PEP-CTERM/exosortase system [Halioglobus sp.]